MRKNRYTQFQEAYDEPGITFTELAGALNEAGVYQPPQRIRKYAETYGLVVDLGETQIGPRFLIKLSNVPAIMDGLRVPINQGDLEKMLALHREIWLNQLVKEIKRRKST